MRIPHISTVGGMMVTTFGLGLLRPAPGTWGSMPPVIVAVLLLIAGAGPTPHDGGWVWSWGAWTVYHAVMATIAIVFSIGCLAWGNEAEAAFGKKDPGSVCADETAGMSIALMFLPAHALGGGAGGGGWAVWTLLIAFLTFRATDILKLPPARSLQRHPAGLGILIDDLVAGVQALLIVQLVTRLAMT